MVKAVFGGSDRVVGAESVPDAANTADTLPATSGGVLVVITSVQAISVEPTLSAALMVKLKEPESSWLGVPYSVCVSETRPSHAGASESVYDRLKSLSAQKVAGANWNS